MNIWLDTLSSNLRKHVVGTCPFAEIKLRITAKFLICEIYACENYRLYGM